MSVLQTPVNVMRTLIVPTAPVLIAVLVNRDLPEMGQLVKVSGHERFEHDTYIFLQSFRRRHYIRIPFNLYFSLLTNQI